jgi:hypothetical protein
MTMTTEQFPLPVFKVEERKKGWVVSTVNGRAVNDAVYKSREVALKRLDLLIALGYCKSE